MYNVNAFFCSSYSDLYRAVNRGDIQEVTQILSQKNKDEIELLLGYRSREGKTALQKCKEKLTLNQSSGQSKEYKTRYEEMLGLLREAMKQSEAPIIRSIEM